MTIKLIKPEVEIVDVSKFNSLTLMEHIGRVCYNSYDKVSKDSYIKFCQDGEKKGHRSIFEFNTCNLTICEVSKSELFNLKKLLYNFSIYTEYTVSKVCSD